MLIQSCGQSVSARRGKRNRSIARRVIDTHLNPRFLSGMIPFDVASNVCPAVLSGGEQGAQDPRRVAGRAQQESLTMSLNTFYTLVS